MMKFIETHYRKILLLIPLISLAMHWHVFTRDLVGVHVWRQTQTQTVIDNFYKEDNNIMNPKYHENPETDRVVRMEFPVMQWLFAQVYRVFGPHIAISRVLTFIIGMGSVFGMFFLLLSIFRNKTLAVIGAWCFNFSPVFYYYTINPLPDNFALAAAIWSLVFLFRWISNPRWQNLLLSAIFLSLATLAKLPFIIYGSVIAAYLGVELKNNLRFGLKKTMHASLIYLLVMAPALAWYIWVIPTWGGNGVVKGMIDLRNNSNELLDILQSNLVSTLPELLLNYASVPFFIAGFYFAYCYRRTHSKRFPLFLFWGVAILFYFVFELNMIAKVHDYYLFPFLPILFLIVAYGAWHLLNRKEKFFRYAVIALLLLAPITAYLRANPRWNTISPGFNVDFYDNKETLRNLIPPNERVIVGFDKSHFILLYYIDKKGWAFDEGFNIPQFEYQISQGAHYLYTDAPIDTIPQVQQHLESKIYDEGRLRVYRLK